jgi:hypothetical protein
VIQLFPQRKHLVRAAVLGALLVATLITTLIVGTPTEYSGEPDIRPFELEGWAYGRILPPGEHARYRLRVHVAAAASPERGNTDTDTDAAASSSEFRLLLERRDDSNFVCLRWVDGYIEILRVAGGERADLVGQTSYPLPGIARATGTPEVLIIDRRPGLWTVAHRGRELIVAGDPHAPLPQQGDEAGAKDFAWGSTPEWSLASRALQPIEDIHLKDSFAKVNFNEDGIYDVREGLWDLDAARQANKSVNAFRLRGRSRAVENGSEPAVALFGRSFWRGYRAEAAIKFRRAGAGGIIFAAKRRSLLNREKKEVKEGKSEALPLARYGLLRWQYPELPNGAPGKLDVLDVRIATGADGKQSRTETTLLSLPWTPRRDQWHRVAVSLFDELGEVEINGARAVFRLPAGLRSGECGLFADSRKGVLFDDISVTSHKTFLHRPGIQTAPWAAQADDAATVYRLPAGPAWLRLGVKENASPARVSWRNASGATVSVKIDPASGQGEVTRMTAAGSAPRNVTTETLAKFKSAGKGAYSLRIGSDACTILRGPTAVASFPLDSSRKGALTIDSPEALAELAGGVLAPVPALRHKTGSFDEVDVRMSPNGLHPEFKWTGFVGWMKDESSWTRGPDGLLTCRTLLWGPCEVSVEVSLSAKEGAAAELRLAPDVPDAKPLGVVLRRASDGFTILDSQGNEHDVFVPAKSSEDAPKEKVKLTLRRAGGQVDALVGGERVFTMPLAARTPVHVEARAPKLTQKAIKIRSDTVDESLFESAPTEWTRWRGHWDITSKWQCAPQWTFLGVWSDGLEKKTDAAGVFTRASYFGDQDLRFYYAFRDVLGNKYGDSRRYVRRDLNFAFACDGEDPASGYSLLIGGFDNRGTQLLRRGKIVHEVRDFKIPPFEGRPHDIHWQWYVLRILRRGGKITATVNDKEVISWTDPEPLEGGHIGAWTLGGGMILGRTRFSAERRGDEMHGFAISQPHQPVKGWWPIDEDHAASVTPTEVAAAALAAQGKSVGDKDQAPRVVRVTSIAAGGHLGVACSRDENEPSPGAIAFRAEPGVSVRAYVVPSRAAKPGVPLGHRARPRRILPARGTQASTSKSPLPADGKWHVLLIPNPIPKDKMLVIGNWESDGYTAAGIGANAPGASYEVGVFTETNEAHAFVWRVEENRFLSAIPPNPRGGSARSGTREAARSIDVSGGWEALEWGNPAKVYGHKWPGHERKSLLLRSSAGTNGLAVVRLTSPLSLAAKGTLKLDVWNDTEHEIPVAFGVWSGVGFVYSESTTHAALPQQWNHIEFDLAAHDFKNDGTVWKYKSALHEPERVREVSLVFYGNAPHALAVENIEMDVTATTDTKRPLLTETALEPQMDTDEHR